MTNTGLKFCSGALFLLLCVSAHAGEQTLKQDTYTHKVIKPPSSSGAAFDIDFSNVTTNLTGGGGGGGVPGGLPQQLQFNNAGIFGGIPYATFDGNTLTLRSGSRLQIADATDGSKRLAFDLSLIPASTTRTLSIAPSANSTSVIGGSAVTSQFVTAIGTDGIVSRAPITSADIGGSLTLDKLSLTGPALVGRQATGLGPAQTIQVGSGLNMNLGVLTAAPPPGLDGQFIYNSAGAFAGTNLLNLSGGSISADSSLTFRNATDTTKQMQFDLSGLGTGVLAVVNVPNSSTATLVKPDTGAANQFLTGITANGIITKGVVSVLASAQLYVEVPPVGNDGTGTRGDRNKPFATVSAAAAASSAGDAIFVGPGLFDQGTNVLVVPSVAFIGSGVDITTITSAVPKSSNRCGVEPSSNSQIANLTIRNTATVGEAFGSNLNTANFTNVAVSGVKFAAVDHAIHLEKATAGTSGISFDNCVIASQTRGIYSNLDQAVSTFRSCQVLVDGAATTEAIGISDDAGLLSFTNGSVLVKNNATTQVACRASHSNAVVTLSDTIISRPGTATTNFDIRGGTNGSLINYSNVYRDDGSALVIDGVTHDISRYASIDRNLGDLTDTVQAAANLGLTVGSDVEGWSPVLDLLAGLPPSLTGHGLQVIRVNAAENGFEYAAGGAGGTPGGSDKQVQFNDGGSFGGNAGLTFDKTADTLTVTSTPPPNTSVAGLQLIDDLASVNATTQQYPPMIYWRGHGWKSGAPTGDQTVEWRIAIPVLSGSAGPTSYWALQSSINGVPFIVGTRGWSSGGFTIGSGVDPLSGGLEATGKFILSGSVSPPTLTGDVQDYNPTSQNVAATLRINGGTADRIIGGLAGGVDGRIETIVNVGATNKVTLTNLDAGSTAANQFLFPGGNVTLDKDTSLALRYDGTSSKWRAWSRALVNTGVTPGSYTNTNLTVDQQGRILTASNGSAIASTTNVLKGDGAGNAVSTGLAAPSGPFVGTSDTQTLTNKRINLRVDDQNPPTSPYACNSDSFDGAILRGINAALTVNAPTGTPVGFQKLMLRFKDDGTARALTFQTGSSGQFRASSDLALPTTTTAGKTLYCLFVYNAIDSRWDLLAKLDNF